MSSRDNGRARAVEAGPGFAPVAGERDRAGDGAGSTSGSLLFREVNERIRELEGERVIGGYDFVCECEDATCTGTIRMTVQQYEAVRGFENGFAVLPGHERPATEEMISRTDGYVVVAKRILDGSGAGAP